MVWRSKKSDYASTGPSKNSPYFTTLQKAKVIDSGEGMLLFNLTLKRRISEFSDEIQPHVR